MPSAVIDAMTNYRAALDAQERVASTRMAAAWLDATRGLDSEMERLALELSNAANAGRPVRRWHVLRMERYQSLMRQMGGQMREYAPVAVEQMEVQQQLMARWGIEHAEQLVNLQTEGITGQFNRLPVSAVQNMVGNAGDGTPLGQLLRTSWGQQAPDVAGALVRGVALGWHPSKIAQAMRQAASVPLERAIVIARTESLRVYRESSRQSYQRSGLVSGYMRIAAKSTRTCVACLFSDGNFYPLDVPFEEHVQGRCLTPGTLVSGPTAISFVSRYYVGEVVEITTASGNFLSVTPNHPVLTDRGWVAAQFIQEGDNVISSGNGEGVAFSANPNEYQVPTVVENIPRALNMDRLAVMPVAAENFHGDGIGSDIYVVWANRFLRNTFDATSFEPLPEHDFSSRNMRSFSFSGLGNFDSVLQGMLRSASGFLGDTDTTEMFFSGRDFGKEPVSVSLAAPFNARLTQSHGNRPARNTVSGSESVFGFARQVPGSDFVNRQGQSAERASSGFLAFDDLPFSLASEQPASLEFVRKALLASVKSDGSVLRTIASNVCLDSVLKVNRVSFSGHVYNLQTSEQWYIANGIITHNCQAIPKVKGAAPIEFEKGPAWFARQDAATQRAMLGPGRYDAWQSGKFDLADVVARVENDTWGASLQVRSLAELLSGDARAAVAVTPAPVVPTWSPSMSRAEAERWAANSAYKDDVYHVTSGVANERSIKANGFNLSNKKFGRLWGDGVYVGTDTDTAEIYRRFTGPSARTLTIKTNVSNPYIVDIGPGMREPHDIIAKVMGITKAKAKEMWQDEKFHPRGNDLSKILSDAGYDALLIRDSAVSRVVGGNQLVVFDPKKVVVIND